MKKVLSILLCLACVLFCMPAMAESYTAASQGLGGEVPVTVTIEDGKITAVEVGENNETPGVGSNAIDILPGKIVETQSIALDAVTGATITSGAILAAVEDALNQAGLDAEAFKIPQDTEALPMGEAETTDVVIVGAGMAGLMAAYELKQDYPDIQFVLLEKQAAVAGSVPLSGGMIVGISSELHKKYGAECTTEDIAELMDYTSRGAEVNDALTNNVYAKSDLLIERLVEYGADFQDFVSPASLYSDKVFALTHADGGHGFGEFLRTFASNDEFDLRLSTKAEDLLVEDGQVVGVMVNDGEKRYELRAKAVLLATGGFGNNTELMEKYLPEYLKGNMTVNGGATGDSIGFTEQFGTPLVGEGAMGTGGNMTAATFMVNQEGKRFMNELTPGYTAHRLVAHMDGEKIYRIADGTFMYLDWAEGMVANGALGKFDSLEAVAEAYDINMDNLMAEAKAYNAAIAEGKDIPTVDGDGIPLSSASGLSQAPFYVEEVVPTTFGTIMGLKVNENCQLLDGEDNPIPGLYGAGEMIAGNAFTGEYAGSGIGISWAANTGRYAAEQIGEAMK